VTELQIERAAAELARHYGRLRIVLTAPSANTSRPSDSQNEPTIADPDFWSKREEEFRRHDPGPKAAFCAAWFSWGDHWMLYSHSDASTPQNKNTFKSLGREAAKGLGSRRGAEAWKDWLDLLRLARDEETRRPLYSEETQSSRVMSESEVQRCVEAGEVVPAREQIEYIAVDDGAIEKRMYWDTTDSTLKNVFAISAEHCLRLRSIVSLPETKDDLSRQAETASESRFQAEQPKPDDKALGRSKTYKTAAGSNIDRIRKECGWSFDELAARTGLDKKLILSHVNEGVRARPRTLRIYADAFSKALKRAVSVVEIEGSA
jgi:hypothetical protein